MPISRVQNVSANASSATLSSTTANDLIVVFAYNNASTTAPTLVSGYTSLDTQGPGGSANGCRLAYKLSGGGETTTGTWTTATNVVAHVYRGQITSGAGGANGIGFLAAATGNSAIFSWTGTTLGVTDGSSWVAGFGGAKSATAGVNGNSTGGTVLTNATAQTIITGKDTNAGVASFSTTTLTFTTSSRWITEAVEIKNAPAPTPDLILQPLLSPLKYKP